MDGSVGRRATVGFHQATDEGAGYMHVIGLMSGTSVDGIDAALVEISGSTSDLSVQLVNGQTFPYPDALRQEILAVCGGAALSMAECAALDDAIATEFARAAIAIQQHQPPAQLIGSHGQTVFHRPRDQAADGQPAQLGYSLQLGRGALIAHLTQLPTISNFRAADIAAGGQGAPMVPKIDAYLLGDLYQSCCVQNLGGIGNVAYLPPRSRDRWEQEVLGWDTGPGNSLIDLAVHHLTYGVKTYDHNGSWAAAGSPHLPLVEQWLQQPFFQQPPPKSTGRELFGEEYLRNCIRDCQAHGVTLSADILATLTELTAAAIAHSYHAFLPQLPDRVLLCGGGSKNRYLTQRIQHWLPQIPVLTTTDAGVDADFKEAIAFAVLAYWRAHNIPGNLPTVTGAKRAVFLGEISKP
ncbi:MAG: anhydro-N-acetylmuramic acid kinase [Leptolyngbyaceae cyanobacterium bins.349]|nr:anhydro-N-acetylmuramic acid kinase [Leptolyngbyaceae cyanobacterium bins.349]